MYHDRLLCIRVSNADEVRVTERKNDLDIWMIDPGEEGHLPLIWKWWNDNKLIKAFFNDKSAIAWARSYKGDFDSAIRSALDRFLNSNEF